MVSGLGKQRLLGTSLKQQLAECISYDNTKKPLHGTSTFNIKIHSV